MRRLIEWWRDLRNPPAVLISHFGQKTPRPQVQVSVASRHGCQGVYTWDADEQGNAKATMYGRGLAEITRRRLIDERPKNGSGDSA